MDIILNAKIQTRLIAGFATILGLLIATTVIGVVQVSAIDRSLTTINDVNGLKQRYAINFRGSVHDRAIAVRDVIILSEQAEVNASVAEIRTLEGFYDEAAAGMATVFADPELITDEEKRIFASIQEIETRTLPMIETIISDQAAGNIDAARELLVNEARGAFVTWLARINEFIDLQENNNSVISTKARGLANNFSLLMLSITAACILIGVGFAAWSIKSIRSLNSLTPNMLALADGDLEVDIPESTTRDEVGEITKAVHVFKKNAIAARENEVEAERLRQESAASEERAKEQQVEAMNSLAAGFEKDVMGIVDSLSQSSQELRRAAEGLSETAVQAGSKTEEVANSTAQASESVETVVESSGRIEQSIGQISSQIDVSSAKTKVAAEQAAETNQIIDGLSSKAESIGEVINLITDIAAQTNLLALNATIEAARAGEAGKGFAVVASEVKSLATQTTRATEEISTRVTEIQSATNSAVDAIKSINTTIEDVNAIATDISGAIGMQRDATTEIVQHVGHATSSVGVVATSVGDLREASGRTQDSSQKLLSSASMLSDQAEGLRAQVGSFLSSVKT